MDIVLLIMTGLGILAASILGPLLVWFLFYYIPRNRIENQFTATFAKILDDDINDRDTKENLGKRIDALIEEEHDYHNRLS
jgi:hypothetical protein